MLHHHQWLQQVGSRLNFLFLALNTHPFSDRHIQLLTDRHRVTDRHTNTVQKQAGSGTFSFWWSLHTHSLSLTHTVPHLLHHHWIGWQWNFLFLVFSSPPSSSLNRTGWWWNFLFLTISSYPHPHKHAVPHLLHHHWTGQAGSGTSSFWRSLHSHFPPSDLDLYFAAVALSLAVFSVASLPLSR